MNFTRIFFPMRIPGFSAPIRRQVLDVMNITEKPLGHSQRNVPNAVAAQAYTYDTLIPLRIKRLLMHLGLLFSAISFSSALKNLVDLGGNPQEKPISLIFARIEGESFYIAHVL